MSKRYSKEMFFFYFANYAIKFQDSLVNIAKRKYNTVAVISVKMMGNVPNKTAVTNAFVKMVTLEGDAI